MTTAGMLRGCAGAMASIVVAWTASGMLLACQQDAGQSQFTAWLQQPTPAAAEAAVQECLATLAPAQRGKYLREVGQALNASTTALPGDGARRCVQAHGALLAAYCSVEPKVVEWFSMVAAQFLHANDDAEAAIDTLAACERMMPDAVAFRFLRRRVETDCRIVLHQLAAADRVCGELAKLAQTPLEHVQVLVRQGNIDVMLGRLDLAARRLEAAADSLAAITPVTDDVRNERYQLLLHQVELLTGNEQYAAVPKAIARFVAEWERGGGALNDEQRLELQLHETAAEYLRTQHDPARIDAAIAAIDRLLTSPGGARGRNVALVWQADLALRTDHIERATALLDRVDATTARSNRWLAAAVRAEAARRANADRAELLQHEAALRAILQDMVAEWRDFAWDGESTGFLRIASRLRVLGELIAVTSILHGPECALADVFTVQCCTAVSRARGATALPLAELRERVLAEDHGALVFVPAWNTSHVFAFDRSHFVHRELPRASELRRQSRALRIELLALDAESVPVDALSRLQDAGRSLADSLLPAEVRELMARWQQVTITGGNLLGGPTFACLPWNANTLLGERFAVATIASLPLLAKLHADAGAPAPLASLPTRLFATLSPEAAFVARNHLTTLGTLAGPAWERLLAQLPRGAATYIGPGATVTAWLRSNDDHPRLTVLMAHGEPASTEGSPAFGLSADGAHPDGLLTPTGVRASPQTGLVVIAACHAAQGELRMGDDDVADSLAGAFLFAGASSVIASAAPLRANLHTEVGAALLAALATGAGPAEALHRARLAIGDGDQAQRWRAGQIELIGQGTVPLVVPVRSVLLPWSLAALLAAAITAGWCVVRYRWRWPRPASE